MNVRLSKQTKALKRRDDSSLIIHFDCFYASVFESENPSLRTLPLAVQQKQIIVTCNYEARRRGLKKLQLIKDAKRICPDVVIVLGEDLTRFRNASKDLYNFLRAYSWNGKVERLGFDEVFLDVTDLVDFNVDLLNRNDLCNSFFCLSRSDPTSGFAYDATTVAGFTYSVVRSPSSHRDLSLNPEQEALRLRLVLGSHLAEHLRFQLEEHRGYTSTVGISTSKLLAKLVGNLHKPKGQTTLMPPYPADENVEENNVTAFIDDHEVGKIPGIGFKMAQKIRHYVLGRPAEFDDGLVYGGTKERVLVKDVRTHPNMTWELLEKILSGPGAPHGTGLRIWSLLHGIDDAEVGRARDIPKQISLEDSYLVLDSYDQALQELRLLSKSLLYRMHEDLMEAEEESYPDQEVTHGIQRSNKRWAAYPKTIRLSTRPRPAQNPDGSRNRNFARISRSGPLPSFVFSMSEPDKILVERLVNESLVPLFRKLHPEKSGWNLSLINVAVTDMIDAGGDTKTAAGRDISKMFKQQDAALQKWKIRDEYDEKETNLETQRTPQVQDQNEVLENADSARNTNETNQQAMHGSEDQLFLSSQATSHAEMDDAGYGWDSSDEPLERASSNIACATCGAFMPAFAMEAHERFHDMED